jgi:hypothetical protein
MPRIVENIGILYFIPYALKIHVEEKTKSAYVYVLDGIVVVIREVGISGSRSSPNLQVLGGTTGRAQR